MSETVPAKAGVDEAPTPVKTAPVEVKVAKSSVVELSIGFYIANGVTHKLHRVDGEIWRGDRRFQAQRVLRGLNEKEWAIVEVTANNLGWGE